MMNKARRERKRQNKQEREPEQISPELQAEAVEAFSGWILPDNENEPHLVVKAGLASAKTAPDN